MCTVRSAPNKHPIHENVFTFVDRNSKIRSGFTLIELLVVISIIGILATLVTANLNAARSRARDAVRKADLKNIQMALRLYYNDGVSYPASISFGFPLTNQAGTTTYMSKIPNDPLSESSTVSYSYTPSADLDSFVLTACLENKSDSECDVDSSGNVITCSDGSGCSYSISP